MNSEFVLVKEIARASKKMDKKLQELVLEENSKIKIILIKEV